MNDTNYMDNIGTGNGNDVLVANETNVKVRDVSVADSSAVTDTSEHYRKAMLLICIFGLIVLVATMTINVNATENSVYVDEEYLASQFGSYEYYAILNNGSGSYATIYSESPIYHGGSLLYSFLEGGNFGYKMMKLENDYLVVDENGSSYEGSASSTIVFNTHQYLSSSFCNVSYSNVDMYGVNYGVGGTPSPGTELKYSVADNIGSKPIEEPAPDENGSTSCTFTDENIVNSIDTLNTDISEKIDIVIMLLLVMIALRMFSPLANNHKRGLEKKGN